MTIDAVRAGFRVVEIPVAGLTHRATGRTLRGFLHRGRQGLQIARASMAAGGALAMKAGRLAVANHRGVMVPRTLGLWLAGAALVSSAAVAAFGDASVTRAGWGALAATMLVFAAGLVDDLVPDGPRGIREHVGALASGHVSTGIVKVLVIVASAVVAVALQPERSGWIRVGRRGAGRGMRQRVERARRPARPGDQVRPGGDGRPRGRGPRVAADPAGRGGGVRPRPLAGPAGAGDARRRGSEPARVHDRPGSVPGAGGLRGWSSPPRSRS